MTRCVDLHFHSCHKTKVTKNKAKGIIESTYRYSKSNNTLQGSPLVKKSCNLPEKDSAELLLNLHPMKGTEPDPPPHQVHRQWNGPARYEGEIENTPSCVKASWYAMRKWYYCLLRWTASEYIWPWTTSHLILGILSVCLATCATLKIATNLFWGKSDALATPCEC